MNLHKLILPAACFALSFPLAVQAQPTPEREHEHCQRGDMSSRHGEPMLPGAGFMDEGGRLPPFLHGIDLTESQHDAIFAILHAQAPQLRDRMKAVRTAHAALHALTMSSQFDETKAQGLARSIADGMGIVALMRARSEQQIYALLTPKQRNQMEKLKAGFELRPTNHATSGTFIRSL